MANEKENFKVVNDYLYKSLEQRERCLKSFWICLIASIFTIISPFFLRSFFVKGTLFLLLDATLFAVTAHFYTAFQRSAVEVRLYVRMAISDIRDTCVSIKYAMDKVDQQNLDETFALMRYIGTTIYSMHMVSPYKLFVFDDFGIKHDISQYLSACDLLAIESNQTGAICYYSAAESAYSHCRHMYNALVNYAQYLSEVEINCLKITKRKIMTAYKDIMSSPQYYIESFNCELIPIVNMLKYCHINTIKVFDSENKVVEITAMDFAKYLTNIDKKHDLYKGQNRIMLKMWVAAQSKDPNLMFKSIEKGLNAINDIIQDKTYVFCADNYGSVDYASIDVPNVTEIPQNWKGNTEMEKFNFDELQQKIQCCSDMSELQKMKTQIYNQSADRAQKTILLEQIKKQEIILQRSKKYEGFLATYDPQSIEDELNKRIIGQPVLTHDVADFLYYHALRQMNPGLPPRPMMISGTSGSGKTEVWRVAQRVFGDVIKIKIVDGSRITSEGWKGGYKLTTLLTKGIADGGIFIVDEFDKLTKPTFNSSEENVSLDLQAEFLKVLEGEYEDEAADDTSVRVDSSSMGFVLIGAFEAIRERKRDEKRSKIGFNQTVVKTAEEITEEENMITDEEYIEYGIIPELVGRIATKCWTKPLSDDDYLRILKNPYSRVSNIKDMLIKYGINPEEAISEDETLQLVKTAKDNRTGVRWVSAKVEGKLLEYLRSTDLKKHFKK